MSSAAVIAGVKTGASTEETQMKNHPSVGRCVHFRAIRERIDHTGFVDIDSTQPFHAVITYVWPANASDVQRVNLAVTDHVGVTRAISSVRLLEASTELPMLAHEDFNEDCVCYWPSLNPHAQDPGLHVDTKKLPTGAAIGTLVSNEHPLSNVHGVEATTDQRPGRRVTAEMIEALIGTETVFNLGELLSKAGTPTKPAHYRTTVCALTLQNDFLVLGVSSCVDGAVYEKSLGEKYARDDARKLVGEFAAYNLATTLHGH